MNPSYRSLQSKLLIVIILGALVVATITMLYMLNVKQRNTELVGINTAQAIADQTFGLRNFYASEVVSRAKNAGVRVNYDFADHATTLPLPATLVKVLGARFEEQGDAAGMSYYSEYPWPHREGTVRLDEFEVAALEAIKADNDTPYYVLSDVDGATTIRYAVADIMQQSCVDCHNQHPESPRTDWAVGDFRGVLAITVPVEEAESTLQNGMIALSGIVMGGLTLLAGGIVLTVRRDVIKPVNNIIATSERVDAGEWDARAEIETNDELGKMATTFNEMLDTTEDALGQIREQNHSMQQEILLLQDEVKAIANGDLTVKANDSAEMTAPVAEALNFMVARLRHIINQVQQTTLQVSSATNEIQATAEQLAHGSEVQAERIINTTAAIDEMSVSIQQVSENATLSASVGEQARVNARKGAEAVQSTINGMGRIRQQVQQTSRRIKRLGESSQEIGEIVQLISDIASRTSILALNASIQAAMAGEAGRGFAVVAEEVEQLATRSNEAARQIESLVLSIQNETAEAVVAMATTNEEVDHGSQLANEAGNALEEIRSVSNRLAELIQSISASSQQQARGSESIARAMNDIADVTQQTVAGTKEASVSIGNLAELADGLQESVTTFKLSRNGHQM